MRAALLALAVSACATLAGKDVVPDSGLRSTGVAPPRCVEAVVTAADTLLPLPSLRPLHGIVAWHATPFWCGYQTVWGCSDVTKDYLRVQIALPPAGHAADSALPEEVAHWVWQRYRPGVVTEGWRDGVYWRDPDFQRWYTLVADTARGACP